MLTNFSPMTPMLATVASEPRGMAAPRSMERVSVTPPPSFRMSVTFPMGTPERRTRDCGSSPITSRNPA